MLAQTSPMTIIKPTVIAVASSFASEPVTNGDKQKQLMAVNNTISIQTRGRDTSGFLRSRDPNRNVPISIK